MLWVDVYKESVQQINDKLKYWHGYSFSIVWIFSFPAIIFYPSWHGALACGPLCLSVFTYVGVFGVSSRQERWETRRCISSGTNVPVHLWNEEAETRERAQGETPAPPITLATGFQQTHLNTFWWSDGKSSTYRLIYTPHTFFFMFFSFFFFFFLFEIVGQK